MSSDLDLDRRVGELFFAKTLELCFFSALGVRRSLRLHEASSGEGLQRL